MCTIGLNMNIETVWGKLEDHQQTGVFYLLLMLYVNVNITSNIAAVLTKPRIKTLGQKGFSSIYPHGENAKRIVMDMSSGWQHPHSARCPV